MSLHDVAPATWPDCERLLKLTDAWALPVSLLVVPDYHRLGRVGIDHAFVVAFSLLLRAHEIVLHGYSHLDEAPAPRTFIDWWRRRVLTRGEGEMAALDRTDAAQRIAAGMDILDAAALHPTGFIAPAWQLGIGAWKALRDAPLGYTATRDRLFELPELTPARAPSLVYSSRSAWRRGLSRLWNEQRRIRLRSSPLLRVALHPVDARHAAVVRHWRRLIGRRAERLGRPNCAWLASWPARACGVHRPRRCCADEVAEELQRGPLPAEAKRVVATAAAVEPQRALDRARQVLVQAANLAVPHDVDRPGGRVCGDRNAAGHRFQHHDAERIGAAGEYEYVGGGDDAGEFLPKRNQ